MVQWEKYRRERAERKPRPHRVYEDQSREIDYTVNRKWYSEITTIGKLDREGVYVCDILEDTVRDPNNDGILQKDEKVYGKTAIPAGRYKITLTQSTKFNALVPHLLDVPHYKYIYIHWGNWAKDTLGCLLTGTFDPGKPDEVLGSKTAFKKLMPLIEKDLEMGEVYINIIGGPSA